MSALDSSAVHRYQCGPRTSSGIVFESKPFGGSLAEIKCNNAWSLGETYRDNGVDVLHRTRQLDPDGIIASITRRD